MSKNHDLEQSKSAQVVQKSLEETSKSYKCAICFDDVCDPVTLRCGHLFCWPCIDKYWNYDRQHCLCPYCRREIKIEEDVIPVYGQSSRHDSNYLHPRPQAPLFKVLNIEGRTDSNNSTQQSLDSVGFWKAATAVSVAGVVALGSIFAFREIKR
uniref:RING-type E3 ubiquitin transferase n=1 Tax=Syphacia muris TaxID=451379 RepID=A0A0N5ANF8_9BILA